MSPSSNSASRFLDDPRKQHELRMRPVADRIYRTVFGADAAITRYDRADGEAHVLDQTFAIDVQIALPQSGMMLLGQEKFLRERYASFRSVTVEYWQDQATEERGDWFKLACQFYFVGYGDADTMDPWIILDWPRLVWATEHDLLRWRSNVNQDGRARASFRYLKMDDIPSSCVMASSHDAIRRPTAPLMTAADIAW